MECKLEVAVHAHWNDIPPNYRIYVDDDMLTERTFGWTSYQFYILEHILCNLESGIHVLKLQNLNDTGRFELDNFTVNGVLVNHNNLVTDAKDLLWQFTIDTIVKN